MLSGMNRSSLTAKYRPQTFGQVGGQEYIKRILSRACAQEEIASAYIFSGTRGVGKTTLARILAKGINCLNGPSQEPCNECRNCTQITAGTCVDVMEIDGASYTGVDNVRRLREEIFYSPLGCRYKVVIIDEVHMLSTAAFNALLKTIEEPPAHCVFIMATTEPQKIPATVVSRCQHFVFKNLTQAELGNYLRSILEIEGIEYEESAVNILAKRGDGSVRDSISLLGQVLALGGEKLDENDVRQVLGLAGQEFFLELMEAVHSQDLGGIEEKIESLLSRGLDLGFFLRELAQCWRNIFLLQQAGNRISAFLDMDNEFVEKWEKWSKEFSPQYVHAAWQMVLDSQYGVLKSLEPGQALELLLVNLAYLPHLLPVSQVESKSAEPALENKAKSAEENKKKIGNSDLKSSTNTTEREGAPGQKGDVKEKKQDFQSFIAYCARKCNPEEIGLRALKNSRGYCSGKKLVIECKHRTQGQILKDNGRYAKLLALTRDFFEQDTELEIDCPEEKKSFSRNELREKAKNDPGVQKVIQKFNARILEVTSLQDKATQ